MWIQHLDPQKLSHAYDILCQTLYPWEEIVRAPFGAAWGLVRPGERTKSHNHQDGETFFVMQGHGRIRVGDESADVTAGDVIYLPPFDDHTLANTSEDEELLFLTVWWEDASVWTTRARPPHQDKGCRVMVTAAPPTPNGDLHLGHLSGPYLAADIHTRYLRLQGVDAHYVCGTDDNQSYVATRAQQLGLSAGQTADRMAQAIQLTLQAARADLTLFVRPNESPAYAQMVEAFFHKLYTDGKLIAKETPCPYCDVCQRYLFEAHIRGWCPHCGAPTGGNSCEDCGRPNDCINLVDPTCTHCGTKPVHRSFTRLFFPLGQYARQLRDYYRTVAMPAHLRALCEHVLAAGLPDISITHITDWGLPVPLAGFEDQRLYAWFEMAPRYLAYSQQLGTQLGLGGWQQFWKDQEARVVQCFGFDNGFFYAVFIPALLTAYDPDIRLTSAFVMNEFYRLDGKKFSTSRRHAIWGREMLSSNPADLVRFYLAMTCPETEGTNFTMTEFSQIARQELVEPFTGWLTDLGAKIASDAHGVSPSPGDWTEQHRHFYCRLGELAAEAAVAYEANTFSPQRAARVLCTLVREARRFGKAEDHWSSVPGHAEERRTAMALELLAAKTLAILAAPIMPDFSVRLWRALGYLETETPRWQSQPTWVPSGQCIGDLGALAFPHSHETLCAAA